MNWQDKCLALWQDRWKSTLARTVGCTKRAVQYWCSGERNIPAKIEDKINQTYNIWRDDE